VPPPPLRSCHPPEILQGGGCQEVLSDRNCPLTTSPEGGYGHHKEPSRGKSPKRTPLSLFHGPNMLSWPPSRSWPTARASYLTYLTLWESENLRPPCVGIKYIVSSSIDICDVDFSYPGLCARKPGQALIPNSFAFIGIRPPPPFLAQGSR